MSATAVKAISLEPAVRSRSPHGPLGPLDEVVSEEDIEMLPKGGDPRRSGSGCLEQRGAARLRGESDGNAKGVEWKPSGASRWRWVMLAILSLDICVSYLPYYTFVPILRQSTQVYSVDETSLNVLCILYALVYVPGAFFTGPIVGTLGCRWTFVLAMALTTIGCTLRCGPGLASELMPALGKALEENFAPASFAWLVAGQAICALGQPFLVNSTSEMGAEWFPPHERPTAALISNLMNFVGGSLSFMLPPMLVEEQDQLEQAERQLAKLMRVQLLISCATFLLTLCLYRPAPRPRNTATKREPVPFLAEVRGILALKDFWLINAYFTVYVALCHAFDAVEGSLLEHYGYSASLASWTGTSCGVASILVSILEARYLSDASSYKPALAVSSLALVVSLVMGFVCLQFRLHSSIFVIAIGIFGLSVPAWGCSCELGSEVCFPAREATVSSLLEASSNLGGVASIMATQRMLDVGLGAHVLLLMAASAVVGACLLRGTSGRLRRSEAEEAEVEAEVHEQKRLVKADPPLMPVGHHPKIAEEVVSGASILRQGLLLATRRTVGKALISLVTPVVLLRFLLLIPQSQLPEDFAESLSEVHTTPHRGSHNTVKVNRTTGALSNGLPEPRNFVIHCDKDKPRLQRFHKHFGEEETYTVVPCTEHSVKSINEAVSQGLLPETALMAASGLTKQGLERSRLLAGAIAHLKVLKLVAESPSEDHMVANIFEDTEVVHSDYRRKRNELLGRLPSNLDFAKLNVLRPAGVKLRMRNSSEWMHGKVFRMRSRTSPLMNLWLSNYVVTRRGAQRILQIGRTYDTFGVWEIFDIHVMGHLYKHPRLGGLVAFSLRTNTLSTHCHNTRLCYRVNDKGSVHPPTVSKCRGNVDTHPLCKAG